MQPPEQLVQRGRPAGVGRGIHERDRGPRGRDRALGVACQPGGVGQAAQQLDLVEILRPVFGCDLRPERAGAIELAAGGAEGIHLFRGRGGRDRGPQRRPMPLSTMPVLGERSPVRCAARMPGRGCVERRGQCGVHRPALAGQQLAVHRFTGERMAEGVRVSAAYEHVGVQELVQGGGERLLVHACG